MQVLIDYYSQHLSKWHVSVLISLVPSQDSLQVPPACMHPRIERAFGDFGMAT